MPAINWDTKLYKEQHQFVSDYGADVLQWLDPQAGEHILEIGCGTGDLAHKIHASKATLIGVDASADMVASAKQKYPMIQFEQKDAAQLDYQNKFDAVFSNATFHWIENQTGLLNGIYSSLVTGGRLVAEFGGKGNIQSIVDAIASAAVQLGVRDRIKTDFWFFPSIGQYATMLESAGFETEQMWLFDRPTKLVGADGMLKWIHQFAPHAFVQLSAEEASAVTNLAIERLKPDYFKNGEWVADYKRLRIKAVKK